jgi:hypothetical protein
MNGWRSTARTASGAYALGLGEQLPSGPYRGLVGEGLGYRGDQRTVVGELGVEEAGDRAVVGTAQRDRFDEVEWRTEAVSRGALDPTNCPLRRSLIDTMSSLRSEQ